jgi:hypothetical protein
LACSLRLVEVLLQRLGLLLLLLLPPHPALLTTDRLMMRSLGLGEVLLQVLGLLRCIAQVAPRRQLLQLGTRSLRQVGQPSDKVLAADKSSGQAMSRVQRRPQAVQKQPQAGHSAQQQDPASRL